MDFIGIGWREGLLLAIVLVAVYLVVALLGLARLKRRPETVPAAMPASMSAIMPGAEPPLAAGEPPDFLADALSVRIDDDERGVAPAAPAIGDGREPDFAGQLAWREIEAEVGQLRMEVAALRRELDELRNERVQRRMAPHYAEAAALAERGFDARGVAEECGISVAEAELVLAMSRDEKTFDDEDDHDGIRYAPAGR